LRLTDFIGHFGCRNARRQLWRSADVCGFGSDTRNLGSGYLRVVANEDIDQRHAAAYHEAGQAMS
jgi:hypothetical protein